MNALAILIIRGLCSREPPKADCGEIEPSNWISDLFGGMKNLTPRQAGFAVQYLVGDIDPSGIQRAEYMCGLRV